MTATENVLTSVLFNEKKSSGKIDGFGEGARAFGVCGFGKRKI